MSTKQNPWHRFKLEWRFWGGDNTPSDKMPESHHLHPARSIHRASWDPSEVVIRGRGLGSGAWMGPLGGSWVAAANGDPGRHYPSARAAWRAAHRAARVGR